MAQEMRFESPEAEIKYLEGKILEKKRELTDREPRALVRETIEEHVGKETAPPQPLPQTSAHASPPPDLPNQITMYIEQAFQVGIVHAVKQVRATHNPYLIDAFHDALADRFLDALRAKGFLDTKS